MPSFCSCIEIRETEIGMEYLNLEDSSGLFRNFERISRIPRGSGNTAAISAYVTAFARERGLEAFQDAIGNVLVRKPAAPGSETAEPVILQGHLDMVCVSDGTREHDFQKDPLELFTDGDWLGARGTTLGADDGFAVAAMLAIMEDPSLPAPPLELVFTVNEETDMSGAEAFDYSLLRGRRMINLDSEDEGILTAGCAGGTHAVGCLPVSYCEVGALWYEVCFTGLLGGHSGTEIHCGRINAALLAGRFLKKLEERLPFALSELESGTVDNAIPDSARMLVGIGEEDENTFKSLAEEFQEEIRREYAGTDGSLLLQLNRRGGGAQPALGMTSLGKLLLFLNLVPNGVQKMNGFHPELVETSTNLGVLKLLPDKLYARFCIRSSDGAAGAYLTERICMLTEFLGGSFTADGQYPVWEYAQDSPFRERMLDQYRILTGKEMTVDVIHAGLECGYFYDALPGLECVSIGPDIPDIHTAKERLSISSAERVYTYLLRVLASLA